MVQAALHQLNDAQLAMKILDKYLEYIEKKLYESQILISELTQTDTYSIFDSTIHELWNNSHEIDTIIKMCQYNGKNLIINTDKELTPNEKNKYKLKWNIAHNTPLYHTKNLDHNDLIIDPIPMSAKYLGLNKLMQDRGSICINTNEKNELNFATIGKQIYYKQYSYNDDKILQLAIHITDVNINEEGTYYIKGNILGKEYGTNCSIINIDPNDRGYLVGISIHGSTITTKNQYTNIEHGNIIIDEDHTDPFNTFIDNNYQYKYDGYNITLDTIVNTIIYAQDKCMVARTTTSSIIDMIIQRRDQIIKQYKNDIET